MNEEIKVFGCVPSTFDGTENIYSTYGEVGLPETYSYIKYLPSVLNQGSKPICVPCSVSAYINYSINTDKGTNNVNNHVDVDSLFTGTSEGMSIKECLNNLKVYGVETDEGLFTIKRYARIGNLKDLKAAIVANGPCIGAIGVYNSQLPNFWLQEGGNFEGGHAIAIVGYDEEGLIIRNSWGKYYGKDGYYHLPYEDLELFYELWTIIY